MSTFVLIHGAWHGAWCWEEVGPRLAEHHAVYAIDLPGRICAVVDGHFIQLRDYVSQVEACVLASPEPVILVGHSLGGVVISQVAENIPEKIEKLIYVAGYVPNDGQSFFDLAKAQPRANLKGHLHPDVSENTFSIEAMAARRWVYNGCAEQKIDAALERLCLEPLSPLNTPVHLTQSRFGRIPKCYIACELDEAVPIAYQKTMSQAQHCTYFQLPCSHMPQYHCPELLAQILMLC